MCNCTRQNLLFIICFHVSFIVNSQQFISALFYTIIFFVVGGAVMSFRVLTNVIIFPCVPTILAPEMLLIYWCVILFAPIMTHC